MTLNLPPTPPDWSDHQSGPVAPPLAPARAVFRRALTHGPRWLGAAMALRNLVVRPFGLVTRVDDATGPAGFLDSLPVIEDSNDRFETGLTDRHLTFTLVTEIRDGQVHVSTRIWFHHALGRLYLALVWPAHELILRAMLRGLARETRP